MKRILLTGAAGNVGYETLRQLVNTENYYVTALDLKSKKSVNCLNKYKKEADIVFGDINDKNLINNLVKASDVVIHLAAVLPPLADENPELTKLVNYEGTKNIVEAIKNYNPECFLIFSSSISVYGDRLKNPWISVKDSIGVHEYDCYANIKIETEKLIKKELKNYTIFRFTAIMGLPQTDPLMFHMPLNTPLEISTEKDTARALVKSIEHLSELKRKTFNLAGGEKCRTTYREFLIQMFKIYGLKFSFLKDIAFAEKNFHCGYLLDSDKLENILEYRKDTLNSYFKRVEKETSNFKRFFAKVLSYPIIMVLQKKSKPLLARQNNDKKGIERFFNKK